MKNKGFTLVEIILVIVIIGIIGAITIPGVMDSMAESQKKGGETVERLLETNLELYNMDNKDDLWCLDNSDTTKCTPEELAKTKINVSLEDLYNLNPDIDMGECKLNDENSLVIKRSGDNFTYHANVICSKNFISKGKIATTQDKSANLYYSTPSSDI